MWGVKTIAYPHSKYNFLTDFCISLSKACFPSQFSLFQPSNTLGFHYCALHERRSKTQWTINSGRGSKSTLVVQFIHTASLIQFYTHIYFICVTPLQITTRGRCQLASGGKAAASSEIISRVRHLSKCVCV
jgi:hypothetical protein